MHELGICEAVLERVEARAAGRRVEGVGLRAGRSLRLAPEAVQQSFDLLALGGAAEGAKVDLEEVSGDELVVTWLRYVDTGPDAVPHGSSTTSPQTTEA